MRRTGGSGRAGTARGGGRPAARGQRPEGGGRRRSPFPGGSHSLVGRAGQVASRPFHGWEERGPTPGPRCSPRRRAASPPRAAHRAQRWVLPRGGTVCGSLPDTGSCLVAWDRALRGPKGWTWCAQRVFVLCLKLPDFRGSGGASFECKFDFHEVLFSEHERFQNIGASQSPASFTTAGTEGLE